MTKSSVLITGAASGIGAAVASRFAGGDITSLPWTAPRS